MNAEPTQVATQTIESHLYTTYANAFRPTDKTRSAAKTLVTDRNADMDPTFTLGRIR